MRCYLGEARSHIPSEKCVCFAVVSTEPDDEVHLWSNSHVQLIEIPISDDCWFSEYQGVGGRVPFCA